MTVTPRELRRTLDPELISARQMPVTAMRYAETWHKAKLFAYEDKAVRGVYARYVDAFRDIRQSARAQADRLDLTTLRQDRDSVTWKRAVMDAVRPRLTRLSDELATDGLEYSVAAYYAGYYARVWQLDVATKPEVVIRAPALSFPQVTGDVASTLRESVHLREQTDVYRQLIRSLLTSEWRGQYMVHLTRLSADIEIAISSGMSAGEGIEDIMRRVRVSMGIEEDWSQMRRVKSPVTPTANFNRIETLTRTVVNKASNDGAWNAYRANADVVSGYQWITARDERVCPECRDYNMVTYQLDDYFRPPAHPRCRCTIIPTIADRLLVIADELPRESFSDFIFGIGAGMFAEDLLQDFLG